MTYSGESPDSSDRKPEPSGRTSGILLTICLIIIVVSSMAAAASYFSATSHSDKRATIERRQLCRTQVFILGSMKELANTAETLVASDTNIDQQLRSVFIAKYEAKKTAIDKRIHNARVTYCPN